MSSTLKSMAKAQYFSEMLNLALVNYEKDLLHDGLVWRFSDLALQSTFWNVENYPSYTLELRRLEDREREAGLIELIEKAELYLETLLSRVRPSPSKETIPNLAESLESMLTNLETVVDLIGDSLDSAQDSDILEGLEVVKARTRWLMDPQPSASNSPSPQRVTGLIEAEPSSQSRSSPHTSEYDTVTEASTPPARSLALEPQAFAHPSKRRKVSPHASERPTKLVGVGAQTPKKSSVLLWDLCTSDKEQPEEVGLLLDAGADVNIRGGYYGTALQAASAMGYLEVAKILVAYGADVNAWGGRYGSAIQAAARAGHKEVVELLLGSGADVNAQGGQYGSALQAASRAGGPEVIRLLLDAGADVYVQGGLYGNVFQAALESGNQEVIRLLQAASGSTVSPGVSYQAAGPNVP